MSLADQHSDSPLQVDPNSANAPEFTDAPSTPERPPATVAQDAVNVLRGFCMGAADTVPGVSGGTVALVLGHYQRLIGSISRVDHRWVKMLLGRQWAKAFDYIDGRFVIALGAGVATGIVTLAGLMHWLLDHRMPETFAVFFGLILASVLIVRRYIDRWSPVCYASCVIGIVIAYAIGQAAPASGSDSLPYLFLSGSVAICAMILPGISGAFVLLLFGVYHDVTGIIKDMTKGINIGLDTILQLGVFAMGCLFGLLAFSKLLRWLLEHHRAATMATLIGLMLGSVRKLWPLQMPTPETAGLKMKERVMEVIPVSEWQGSLGLLIALAIGSAAGVLILERVATKTSTE